MKNDGSTRIIAVIALIVAIVGLSVGFAVISKTLTISSSASVKPNQDYSFSVKFSSSKDSVVSSEISAKKAGPDSINEFFTGKNATITGNGTTLSGVGGTFTEPGQTITYDLFIFNEGKLPGYLTNVTFANASDVDQPVKCTAKEGADATQVAAACSGLKVKLTIDSDEYTGSQANIKNKTLDSNTGVPAKVVVEYAAGSNVADGDFDVAFGDITVTYSTKDSSE